MILFSLHLLYYGNVVQLVYNHYITSLFSFLLHSNNIFVKQSEGSKLLNNCRSRDLNL